MSFRSYLLQVKVTLRMADLPTIDVIKNWTTEAENKLQEVVLR